MRDGRGRFGFLRDVRQPDSTADGGHRTQCQQRADLVLLHGISMLTGTTCCMKKAWRLHGDLMPAARIPTPSAASPNGRSIGLQAFVFHHLGGRPLAGADGTVDPTVHDRRTLGARPVDAAARFA